MERNEFDDHWVEDILYFEGPLLSLFRHNQTGQLSLHYWGGLSENETANVWVKFDVSSEELREYKDGRLSLYEICHRQPSVYVYALNEDLEVVSKSQLAVDQLPANVIPPVESYYDPDLAPPHHD